MDYETDPGAMATSLSSRLCFKCHDEGRLFSNQSFKHREHVLDQKTPCVTCHDPHGSAAYPHLINFVTSSSGTGRGFAITGAGAQDNPAAMQQTPGNSHEFYFTRGIYSGEFDDYDEGGRWAVDYPKADHQFLVALKRLSVVDAYPSDNAIELTDPMLRRYPLLYAVEVGSMSLSNEEVLALRDYLLAGGFLVIDDFWGSWAWEQLVSQMQLVFPDRAIVELPPDHPVFNAFYNIDHVLQADQGADLDFLVGKDTRLVTRESH